MTSTDAIAERAQAEQLMAAFAIVLTHPAGFGIELFADLCIDGLEDGRFRVARYDNTMQMTSEELFDDANAAIAYYLDLRDELRLGTDYESTKT